MADEVSTFPSLFLPLELLHELVQFFRRDDCTRLATVTSAVTPFVLKLGKRLEDAAAVKVAIVYLRLPQLEDQKRLAQEIMTRMSNAGFQWRDNSNPSNGRKTVGLGGRGKERLLNQKFGNPGEDLKRLLIAAHAEAIPFRGVASRAHVVPVIHGAINHLGFNVVFLRQAGHSWNTGNFVYQADRGVVFALEANGIGDEFFQLNGGFQL